MTWSFATVALSILGACGPPALLATGGCLELPTSAVVRVYDGDTPTVRVESWPPVFREFSIRLNGFDTPEIRGRCPFERYLAVLARESLAAMIHDGKTIRLDDVKRGMYFRLVGTLSVDGVPVADRMIETGLARSYDGEARESWCE